MTHKLVSPDCHHCNIAKQAIQTSKNHVVSILSGVDNRFPLFLWCHLVQPAELTINLLQQSNVALKLSAYAHVHGQHNYMKWPFALLGCVVMAHVKPKNQQTWDVHADTGSNIGMAMEHHQCFHIYIVKTRATTVSDTVNFKHQCITNPQVTPKTLIKKAVLELTSALKGIASRDGKMAEVLKKFGKLFMKIAVAKAATAKAKERWSNLRTHPDAHHAVPLPSMVNRPPILASPLPRVLVAPGEADCCVGGVGGRVQMVGTASQVAVPPTQIIESQSRVEIVENVTPRQGTHRPPIARPNYILQDDDDDDQHSYNTRSQTTSIMQEAMLACIDITKPMFNISAA
jgi:hypothetical protein